MKKWITSLFFPYLISCFVSAQDIPVGTWRNHVSYKNANWVTGDESIVFCAVANGLFSISVNEVSLLSKVNGLSQPGASALHWDPEFETLVIGHPTGQIDLVTSTTVTTLDALSEITRFTNKSINTIASAGGLAYIGTSFGIAVVDLSQQEIREFFSEIGPGGQVLTIRDIGFTEGLIVAASNAGLLLGNTSSNLLDFNNWTLIEGSPTNALLEVTTNEVFVASEFEVFTLVEDSLIGVQEVNEPVRDLIHNNDELFVLSPSTLSRIGDNGQLEVLSTEFSDASSVHISGNVFNVADRSQGLIEIRNSTSNPIIPNGPASDDMSHIEYIDSLYVFYAPSPSSTQVDSTGFSSFLNRWDTHVIDDFYNISDVATYSGQAFLSSNISGIYNLSSGRLEDLPGAEPVGISRIRPGPSFLYGISFNTDQILFQFDGIDWRSFPNSDVGTTQPVDILISQGGIVWIANSPGLGVTAYSPTDNSYISLTTSNGLPSNEVNTIAIDRNDELWIGTRTGPTFVSDASFLDGNTEAIQPFFDGLPLLEGETLTAIAVDGGNRKWMGTENGIWVFSENVDQLDERFTETNSPLLSNEIIEFAYNSQNGEMFILTDRGLCSYRSGSSLPAFTHSNVKVFPNPVNTLSHSSVSINGLVDNANLKITDINGNLVDEINAIGGTATWNLQNLSNNPVQGGVYLFFSSSFDGEETFVGKVAVIR